MIGGRGDCTGLGSAGRVDQLVVLAVEGERSPAGVAHRPVMISSCSSSRSKRSPSGGNGMP